MFVLKSKFLSSVRPFYEADKEGGKSAVELEREKIKVNDSTDNNKKEDDDAGDKKSDDDTKESDDDSKEGDEKGEDDGGDDDKEGDDGDKEKEDGEPKELTPEQKAIKKLEKTVERLQKRVGRTTGERDEIKKQLTAAQASLENKVKDGEQPLNEDEVNRRAQLLADQTVTQREFDAAQARLIKDAVKVDKDFMNKVQEMAKDVAPIPAFMIGALDDLDNNNGGAVLNHLTDNVDEYEEIYNLSPAKMVAKLVKISNDLVEATKPKKKEISKVPKPNEPIGGGTKSPSVLTDKMPMDEWVRKRNEDAAAHRKLKMR